LNAEALALRWIDEKFDLRLIAKRLETLRDSRTVISEKTCKISIKTCCCQACYLESPPSCDPIVCDNTICKSARPFSGLPPDVLGRLVGPEGVRGGFDIGPYGSRSGSGDEKGRPSFPDERIPEPREIQHPPLW
jgi:hypothetical protein